MSDGYSWEQGIVVAEEQFGFEKLNPIQDDGLEWPANREEEHVNPLAVLGRDLLGVLDHVGEFFGKIEMLEPQRDNGSIPNSCYRDEGNECPVALFNRGLKRHPLDHVGYMLQRRDGPIGRSLGRTHILFGKA